jgi:hypothetical protein
MTARLHIQATGIPTLHHHKNTHVKNLTTEKQKGNPRKKTQKPKNGPVSGERAIGILNRMQ